MSRLLAYLARLLPDFVLTVAAATLFSFVVESAFVSGDTWATGLVMPFVVSAAFCCVMYLGGINRVTLVVVIIAVPVLVVASLAVASGVWDGPMFLDEEGNPCLPLFVAEVCAIVVFLLSRSRAGAAVLMLLSVLTCCYVQFLYEEFHAVEVITLFVCLLAMLPWKRYVSTRADEAEQVELTGKKPSVVRPLAAVLCGAVLGCLACAIGIGVFVGVVAPLAPEPMELKVFREYVALPTVQLHGVANEYVLPNDELIEETDDSTQLSSDESDANENESDDEAAATEADSQAMFGGQDAFDSNATPPGFTGINYSDWRFITAIVAVVLLIVAAFALKLFLRRRRFQKMASLPGGEQACEMYRFFLKRLGQMKLGRPAGFTPDEYAESREGHLALFSTDSGVTFEDLTGVFDEAYYGNKDVSQSDLDKFHEFYRHFYKGAREHLGKLRYALKWWRL